MVSEISPFIGRISQRLLGRTRTHDSRGSTDGAYDGGGEETCLGDHAVGTAFHRKFGSEGMSLGESGDWRAVTTIRHTTTYSLRERTGRILPPVSFRSYGGEGNFPFPPITPNYVWAAAATCEANFCKKASRVVCPMSTDFAFPAATTITFSMPITLRTRRK